MTHDRRFITPDDLVLEIQDGQVAPGSEATASGSSSPNGSHGESTPEPNGADAPERGVSLQVGE